MQSWSYIIISQVLSKSSSFVTTIKFFGYSVIWFFDSQINLFMIPQNINVEGTMMTDCWLIQITSSYTTWEPGDPRWNSKRGSFCTWTGHCTVHKRSDWSGVMKNRDGEEKSGREGQMKNHWGGIRLILITIQAGGSDTSRDGGRQQAPLVVMPFLLLPSAPSTF